MSDTCAICIKRAAVATAPLGRSGQLVPICLVCRDEHPRSGRYSLETTRGNDGSRRTKAAI